jgi:succinate dehydrogenase / fumarate reductase, membrane anchor subunit
MTKKDKAMKSSLSRARGLGSSHRGSEHWWVQRLTAVALIPLGLWFAYNLTGLVSLSVEEIYGWIQRPLHTTFILLLLMAGFHHAQLGLQVIIEDYVHSEGGKFALLAGVKFLALTLGVLGAVCLLDIAIH